jgi:hypothetical protein
MAVRLHGPRVRRRLLDGSSDDWISASMLFVRKRLTVGWFGLSGIYGWTG